MSEVTERYLGLGSWTVDLLDDTPADVRRQLHLTAGDPKSKGFGLMVVTPRYVDPVDYPAPLTPTTTPHPLLGAARWAGVVLGSDRRRSQISGAGLLALLADENGVGHMHPDLADKRARAQASTLVNRLIGGGTLPNVLVGGAPGDVSFDPPSPLRVGTINAGGTTLSVGDQILTTRAWLEDVSAAAGRRSYKVRPTGHLDWGTRAQLWPVFPRAIVGRLPAADDPKWITVRTAFDWSESVEGFADVAVADTENPTGPISTTPPTASFVSAVRMDGLTRRTEIEAEEGETYSDWSGRAGEILSTTNTSVISSKDMTGVITPATALEPGEPIYLWDPEAGLFDTTATPITYAGEELRPTARYLDAVTWPIVQGMGVYLLYVDRSFGNAQRVLDLTPHVDFSTDLTAQLEVGAPAPTL